MASRTRRSSTSGASGRKEGSRDEPLPDGQFEEVELSLSGLKFLIHRRTTHYGTELRFGVPDARMHQACVFFIVPEDPELPIQLEWVGHNPACSVPDLPERGGTVAMLKGALAVLWADFPDRRLVHLTDNSMLLRCYPDDPHADAATAAAAASLATTGANRPPPPPVSLAYHSVLLYGRTWYERHFGAHPLSDGHRPKPQDELRRVAAALAGRQSGGWTSAGFDAWFDANVGGVRRPQSDPRWAWLYGPTRACMRDAWTRAPSSWNAFFRDVNERCGCAVFRVLNQTVARGRLGLDMGPWTWEIRRPPPRRNSGGTGMVGGGVDELVRSPVTGGLARAVAAYFEQAERAWTREVGHGIHSRPI